MCDLLNQKLTEHDRYTLLEIIGVYSALLNGEELDEEMCDLFNQKLTEHDRYTLGEVDFGISI
jgi:hypothetical protein